MNNVSANFRILLIVQVIVTFGLLWYSYIMRDVSPSLSELVVGATVAHWLRESASLGRKASVIDVEQAEVRREAAVEREQP